MALSRSRKQLILAVFAILLLVIDQVSKILVKTNMHLGESIPVLGQWFQILFIENEGMAFGMSFGGELGKYLLTTFRIILFGVMLYYIRSLLRRDSVPMGVLVGLTAIMVGALGNIIDCMFYGLIFEQSTMGTVADLVPMGQGYGKFMLGKVVDMLYFPIINTTLPDWFPINGGEQFIFFRPIFNIADSCITVGALYLILFKWRFFSAESKKMEK
ncbi:MAG: lipoprotein signal peptidase [Bacteroidales bacterium]|nr:lipoprotein signal peptidase [Bacteroidales bacterium]